MQDAPTLIEQRFIYVPDGRKFSTLLDVIRDLDGQTLVFAERKVAVDRIEEYLYGENCAVVAIHGDRPMQNRQAALKGFTNGRAQIMVATDVAARGLDIPNVAHVINMDLPTDVDTYTHRIGRTGRAGKRGIATSFWNEKNQQFLAAFVRHLRQERIPIPAGLEKFDPDRRQYAPQRGGRFRRYPGPRYTDTLVTVSPHIGHRLFALLDRQVCMAGRSATVVGLASGDDVIVPSPAFFPSLSASLRVANIGPDSFEDQSITSIIIPRNAESLCSSCFSDCESFSSISFENDS
jgi:hypothetical protein